jgi:hypothetical protein
LRPWRSWWAGITIRAVFAFGTFVIDAWEATRPTVAGATLKTFVAFVAFVTFLIGGISPLAFRTWLARLTRITGIAGHAHTSRAWQIPARRTLVSDWTAGAFGAGWPLGTTAVTAHKQRPCSEFTKAGHAIAFQLKTHVRCEPCREVGQFAQAKHTF